MKCLIGKAKDIVFLYGDWDKNVIKWAKPTPVHHKSLYQWFLKFFVKTPLDNILLLNILQHKLPHMFVENEKQLLGGGNTPL